VKQASANITGAHFIDEPTNHILHVRQTHLQSYV